MEELKTKVEEAYERIRPYVWKTPLMFSQYLSSLGSAKVYLKLESEQLTGSFKIRGAFNKMLLLRQDSPAILEKGVITASTGNHGLACMEASRICGCSLEIFSQKNMSESKLNALQASGAKITRHGSDCVEAEIKARETAKKRAQIYLPPYNDWDVAAGQGTIGYEIYNDLPEVDYVLVSVGGGGLIAGIAGYLKQKKSDIKIIGCQPINSKVMYESVKAGKLVHEESFDTLSDGTAGDIEDGSITFPVCCAYVDEWVLVDEKEIADAVYTVLDKHHKIIEGSAGVAVAAYLSNLEKFTDKNVAIVICGGNMSTTTIKNILQTHC